MRNSTGAAFGAGVTGAAPTVCVASTKTTKPQITPRRICRIRTASKATRSRLRPTRDKGCHRPHMKISSHSSPEPRRVLRTSYDKQRPRSAKKLADLTTIVQEHSRKPGPSTLLNPSDVDKNARRRRPSTFQTHAIVSRPGATH